MKYLIEVPDGTVYGYDKDKKILIFQEKDFIEVSEVSNLIYLPNAVPYEESDRKAVDLQYARDIENVARMNYNEGAKDAWDFAKAINYMGYDDFVSCFDGKTEEMVYELSYSEVKAKYDAWKKSKEEIHVGDEIRIKTSYSADAVVIGMDDYDLFIVWKDGETDRIEPPEREQWVKTGKHFPEVEELLKKITEGSNED